MKTRVLTATAALILGTALSTAAMAQTSPAYRYSGPHAGGPADALIPNGTPRAVVHQPRPAAYRYSGPHAGGPANDLPRN